MLRAVTFDFWSTLFVDSRGREREALRATVLEDALRAADLQASEQALADSLRASWDYLQELAVGGAIMGITGNASYDVLRMLRTQLQQRGILTRKPVTGIDDVRERVADALARAGHPVATFDEIRQEADKGWDVRGAVAAGHFTARADSDGQVIHYRIGRAREVRPTRMTGVRVLLVGRHLPRGRWHEVSDTEIGS